MMQSKGKPNFILKPGANNSGLASLAILTQTAGCRKAQKILDTQKGDYALLSLQELKNRKSGR